MYTSEGRQECIIRRADILTEEYVPERLIGREEQVRQLGVCLAPMKRGQAPINGWLYGLAGTGKTAVARAAISELRGKSSSPYGFYVTCWERQTLYQVVEAMADDLKTLGADAQDTNVKLNRIRRSLDGRPVVVILDDVDRVAPTERERIINGLFTIPQCGLVCISSRIETLESLEEGTKSRLMPVRVPFQAYARREIEEIIRERARTALSHDSWNENLVKRLAAQAGGDARAAIHGLRQVSLLAESSRATRLTTGIFSKAGLFMREPRQDELAERLSEHQRLLQQLVRERGPIPTVELRRIYDEACMARGITAIARRTFSKYVTRLIEQGHILSDGAPLRGHPRLLRACHK